MTDYEKVQVISWEMDRLRQELSTCARSMHRTVFVFITAFVGTIGVYFGKGLIDERQKAVLVLLLSQVEILLCLFYAALFCYQNVRVGYMRALEQRVNELAKDNVIIWNTRITPRYMARPSSAFFAACGLQALGYILIFMILIYFTFEITNHVLWGVGFTIEALACFAVHIWGLVEIGVIERFAKRAQREDRLDAGDKK
ncbi:MAG: hypothetical protein JSV99_11290 [Planctomycetota bacterium]|nr:MAG: hypothetical protein JSV99_11290 [Planctomycetota bacterium]